MATDFSALDAVYPLPPEELYRQWVLTRNREIIPDEWERRSRAGWHLGFHPDARIMDLIASDGTPIGWVMEPLTYLNSEGGIVPEESLTLPIPSDAQEHEIEWALYGRDEEGCSSGEGLVGTWTAVLFAGAKNAPLRRVYLGATHSVVFSAESRTVATTHNLIPDLHRDAEVSRAVDPLARNSYYGFGLTPFRDVHRLLPNHYLDLDTFEDIRHWPTSEIDPLDDGKEGAVAIVDHSRQLLQVLSKRCRRFKVMLSAGRDSRAVLALLRPSAQEGESDIFLSTTVGRDLGSRIDLQAARRLAQIADLPHEVQHRLKRNGAETDRMRAFARIGEGKAGSILLAPRLKRPNRENSTVALAGMAGEVGRGVYWADRELPADVITPQLLVRRTSMPKHKAIVEAAAAWLQDLPSPVCARTPDVLDLAYVEQRLGCWDAPAKYLFPGRRHACSPMAATFNVETMLRLPRRYRALGVLQRDMVAYGWPELLEVPFNEATGLLRLYSWTHRLSRYTNRLRVYLGAVRRQVLEHLNSVRRYAI